MSEIPQRVELPTGTVLWFRPGAHTYWREYEEKTSKCSGRLVGISTVAKALDTNADPLITWGAKLEAQGICELLAACPPDEVEAIVDAGGDALHRDLISAGLDWRSVRDRRATEGTTIHEEVFAALGRGQRPSLAGVSSEIRGYGQAAYRFWLDHGPEPIAVEQIVHTDGVAGRFDLLARIDGKVTLCDAKTSKAAYLSHHVQLAGYSIGAVASGFPEPERTLVVLLRPDGTYECVEGCASAIDWMAACAAYEATKRIGSASRKAAREAVAV